MSDDKHERYLGDGAYVHFDGYHIMLTTGHHDPRMADNRVAMEPEVLKAFMSYLETLPDEIKKYLRICTTPTPKSPE